MTPDCDVLVIGAGPAGCAAAIVAAEGGARVRLLDRAHFPRDKTCGDALSERAVGILRRLGALPSIVDGPHVLVHERAAILPDGARIPRRSATPGMIVPRLHLDHCLRLRAEACGVEVVEGARVRTFQHGPDGAVALCDDRDHRGRVAIAADGPHSVAHASVGHAKPGGALLAVSATAYLRDVRMPEGEAVAEHYFTHALPHGYAWIFPAVEGVYNVGVYQRADAYQRAGVPLRRLLDGFIVSQPARLSGASRVGPDRSWPLPLCGPGAGPVSGPAVLLVGDAAGLVDPLSGEGIWQGLFSGSIAGEIAARAAPRGRFDRVARARYSLRCLSPIMAVAAARSAIQAGMDEVVRRGLYRSSLVRSVLRSAYGAASPT